MRLSAVSTIFCLFILVTDICQPSGTWTRAAEDVDSWDIQIDPAKILTWTPAERMNLRLDGAELTRWYSPSQPSPFVCLHKTVVSNRTSQTLQLLDSKAAIEAVTRRTPCCRL